MFSSNGLLCAVCGVQCLFYSALTNFGGLGHSYVGSIVSIACAFVLCALRPMFSLCFFRQPPPQSNWFELPFNAFVMGNENKIHFVYFFSVSCSCAHSLNIFWLRRFTAARPHEIWILMNIKNISMARRKL